MQPALVLLTSLIQAQAAPLPEVTFVDVAPIIHRRCTPCHRPEAAGPFPMRTYREIAKRGPMIAFVVEDGTMPPWHPADGYGTFKDSLAMTPEERETLIAWIDAGMAQGEPERAPEPPTFEGGWQLGEPDLVVTMTDAFEVPATGADLYRNFVVPLPTTEDRWLTAIEVMPGAPRVLHHIVFDIDTQRRCRSLDGSDGRPGWDAMSGEGGGVTGWDDGGPLLGTSLGGWAVGSQPRHLPMSLARNLPAGADLILRSHFHPSGKVESERTKLGLHFTDKPPAKQLMGLQMPPMFGTAAGIDIPAGESDFVVRDSFTLPVDALALTVGGHAHSILREMRIDVFRPEDDDVESIFWIDDWDFDWQSRYEWAEPVELPAGTELGVELLWDNSDYNPNNPFDPPRRIGWGFQSTDEMGSVTVAMVAKDEADADELWKAIRQYKRDRLRSRPESGSRHERSQAWRMWMADQVRLYDANGDGELSKDELAGGGQQLLEAADKNGDGGIDRDELIATLGDTFVPAAPGEDRGPIFLEDLDGMRHAFPAPPTGTRANVLVFSTVDCPIANGYAPEISSIVRDHTGDKLRFYLVHVDPDVSADAAAKHAEEYGLLLPVLRDVDHRLVERLGITCTPEVAVIDAKGELVYRGRIDDQYREIGRRRPAPTTRDLRDALRAVLAGEDVANPRTEAIGCKLPVRLDGDD
ncbi:MAG: redoxin domain-containing protein [Planctomycetota bacterium]